MLYLNVRKEKDQLCLVRFVYNFIIGTSALQALEKNLNSCMFQRQQKNLEASVHAKSSPRAQTGSSAPQYIPLLNPASWRTGELGDVSASGQLEEQILLWSMRSQVRTNNRTGFKKVSLPSFRAGLSCSVAGKDYLDTYWVERHQWTKASEDCQWLRQRNGQTIDNKEVTGEGRTEMTHPKQIRNTQEQSEQQPGSWPCIQDMQNYSPWGFMGSF